MMVQQFQIVVDRLPTDDQVDALFAMADEPSAGSSPREGVGTIWFDREAPTLADAIASAVRDLESIGMKAIRVDGQDWVTLGDIADRVGRSREMIRLWATGKQGPGGFPPPLNPGCDTSFYSWAEVGPWLREQMRIDVADVEPVLAAANLALQLRALAPRIQQMDVIRDLLAA